MNITKMDLCNRVAKKMSGKSSVELKPVLESFLDEILNVLSEGHRIEIRGFGCFRTKTRQPRLGRNPRTGEQVPIPKYVAPLFKFSKDAQKSFDQKITNKKPAQGPIEEAKA